MKQYRSLLLLVVAPLSTNCNVEDPTPKQEELGHTQDAIGAYVWSSLTVASPQTVTQNVTNTSTNAEYFLISFSGNLASSTPGYSQAEVVDHVGNFSLFGHSSGPPGAVFTVGGAAVAPADPNGQGAFQSFIVRNNGQIPPVNTVTITGVPSNYRCFVTGISNTSNASWSNPSDSVSVSYLGGGVVHINATGNVEASYDCTPMSSGLVSSGATTSTTTFVDMGPQFAGEACFISGLSGSFRSNSGNAVQIFINGALGSSAHWALQGTSTNTVKGDCFI